MRPVAQGRPGTEVIPTGWAGAHAPVLDGTRTATVDLRKPGGTSAWSDDEQRTVTVPHPPYAAAVTARVQAVPAQERTSEVAGDTAHIRDYLVTLDPTLTPADDDLVDVTSCDDADLTGRTLRIVDVIRGSLAFERVVYCTLND